MSKVQYRLKRSHRGFCAEMSISGESWSQVSFWYKTIHRLNFYWGQKNGLVVDPTTNFFVPLTEDTYAYI